MAEISRAELLYQVERQREELTTLNSVGKLLSSTMDPQEVMRLLAAYLKQIPAGRYASATEVAKVIAWLAGDDAGYISGAVIPVDGGLGMGH